MTSSLLLDCKQSDSPRSSWNHEPPSCGNMAYVSNCGFQELQKRIWPADTFVDLDQGQNSAINGCGNRPNDLLNSTRGNPRSRARTLLPATAVLSKIRKMALERLRSHSSCVVLSRQL